MKFQRRASIVLSTIGIFFYYTPSCSIQIALCHMILRYAHETWILLFKSIYFRLRYSIIFSFSSTKHRMYGAPTLRQFKQTSSGIVQPIFEAFVRCTYSFLLFFGKKAINLNNGSGKTTHKQPNLNAAQFFWFVRFECVPDIILKLKSLLPKPHRRTMKFWKNENCFAHPYLLYQK